MSKREAPETKLARAYRETFSNDLARQVLTDLVDFAQREEKEVAVRAGRMDVIARIMREGGRIPNAAPSVYEEDN